MGRLGGHEMADEDLDVCGCDFTIEEGESTRDDALPAAFGGIQAAVDDDCDADIIDGCDVDFNAIEPTSDRDLPVARGGAIR
jgi:hypothetical protein